MQTVFGLDTIATNWPPSTACVGVFDGVHVGHAAIIREAISRARLSGGPAVALTFDRHPMAVLAPQNCPKSILAPHASLRKMEAMGLDVVVVATFDRPFSQLTASDFYRGVLLEKLNTAEMVVGHDFAFGHKRVGTAEWLAEQMPTHIHPPLEMDGVRISSSGVRKAIEDGRVADAGRLLGGSFCLEGVVVRGQRLGSQLGVPTANLSPLFNQVVPGAGIYAGRAQVRGNRYSCAISVGFRPTVSTAGFAVEAHLMDFKDGDLYGHSISLEFVERLRDEVAFESTSALTDQMHVDIENAREIIDSPWLKSCIFGLTALALVYGLLVLVNAIDVSRKPPDEEQIRAAVEEMRQASLEGRDGGVIEYLSDAFELPAGMGAPAGPFNSGRDQVAKFIKNAKVETLEMKTDSVAINGASALANVVTAGTLSYQPFFDSYEFGFPDMQIEFRKETRKRLLIVPDPTWAVIRVHGISAEGFNR